MVRMRIPRRLWTPPPLRIPAGQAGALSRPRADDLAGKQFAVGLSHEWRPGASAGEAPGFRSTPTGGSRPSGGE